MRHIGNTEKYEIYGNGEVIIRRSKLDGTEVQIGEEREFNVVFCGFLFQADAFAEQGHLILRATNIEYGKTTDFLWFGGLGCSTTNNENDEGHFICQDRITKMEGFEDSISVSVHREKGTTIIPHGERDCSIDDPYNVTADYTMVITYNGDNVFSRMSYFSSDDVSVPYVNRAKVSGAQENREAYGKSFLRLLNNKTRERGYQEMKALATKGFDEAAIVLGLRYATEPTNAAKGYFKLAADAGIPEGYWKFAGTIKHAMPPNRENPNDRLWEEHCLSAAIDCHPVALIEMGKVCSCRGWIVEAMYWFAMAYHYGHPMAKEFMEDCAKKWVECGKPSSYCETNSTKYFDSVSFKCALAQMNIVAGENVTIEELDELACADDGGILAAYMLAEEYEKQQKNDAEKLIYNIYSRIINEQYYSDPKAYRCLAEMTLKGNVVPRDEELAYDLYYHAASFGDVVSMCVLGERELNTGNADLASYWLGMAYCREHKGAEQLFYRIQRQEYEKKSKELRMWKEQLSQIETMEENAKRTLRESFSRNELEKMKRTGIVSEKQAQEAILGIESLEAIAFPVVDAKSPLRERIKALEEEVSFWGDLRIENIFACASEIRPRKTGCEPDVLLNKKSQKDSRNFLCEADKKEKHRMQQKETNNKEGKGVDFLQMLSEMHQTGCVANKQYIHANVNDPLFGHSTKTPFFFASAPMLTERHLGILLMTTDGKSLSFKRKCSTDPGPAGMEGGPCDIYIAYTTDGEEYGEIVVNDYCSETSKRPPVGFSFSDDPDKMPWMQKVPLTEPPQKKKDRKKRESKRAKITGTRRFGILWVVLLLITSVGFNMYQYQKNVKIEAELSDATKEIKQLNNANKDLKKEAAGYEDDLYFLKEFVAVRTRSGTGRNMYHTYGCPYLDDLSDITRIVLKTSELSPCCDWCMRD